MVDVRGDALQPPHGTTPAAVKSNKSQVPGTTRLTGFNETHANMQINIVFFRRNRMFNWVLLSCSSDVAVYAHS